MDILERVEVETMRASTRDKEAFQKLSVLILLDMGKKYEEIAETLGIGLGTIGNCKHKYQSDGLYSYLDKHYVPYLGKLTDEQLARLDEEVSQNLYATIGEVVLYIHRTFGIEYCERAVCAILQKLDFVCKKTNNVPCKADPVEQEAFWEKWCRFWRKSSQTRQPISWTASTRSTTPGPLTHGSSGANKKTSRPTPVASALTSVGR